MKQIKFSVDDFLSNLTSAFSVVSNKPTMPILANVRIETKTDANGAFYAELVTSDGETCLQIQTPLIEAEDGITLCVDAKSLLQALRNLSGKEIDMEVNEESHLINCKYDKGHFQLPYVDVEEFPEIVKINTNEAFVKKIQARRLQVAIEKAGFAVANDELRPVMNGVHFDFFKDGMVSVATDSRKLVMYKDLTLASGEIENVQGFTMPQKPCHTLMNLLAKYTTDNSDVALAFNERSFAIKNDVFKMTTTLIEGKFPNYERVIPKNNEKVVIINRNDFIYAVKRVMPMGNSVNELCALDFSLGVMTIRTEDIDFSKAAKESVDCDYASEPLTIGFKGSNLLQVLQNISGEEVKLLMNTSQAACVVKEATDIEGTEYTSLLMPMAINGK